MKDKEKAAAYHKKYYKLHKDHINLKRREWYQKQKESNTEKFRKMKKYREDYYKKHRKEILKKAKEKREREKKILEAVSNDGKVESEKGEVE